MAAYGSQTPSRRLLKRLPTRMLESAVATPLLESYMFKQSHIFDAFNKRFFILFPGYLVYYVKEEEYRIDHEQGHLAHRHGAIKLDGLYLSKPDKKPRGAKYLFVLHAPHKANKRQSYATMITVAAKGLTDIAPPYCWDLEYLLVCQTRELRSHWMIKLQQQNPHLISAQSPDTPEVSRHHSGNIHHVHPLQSQHSQCTQQGETEEQQELEESEDLSDHERHEPDEEESNGTLGNLYSTTSYEQ